MTTWDVVNSKASKTRPRGRVLRTGILVASCAVILTSGMVLTLQEPAPPPAPTFSEQALADAYADALRLRSAGNSLLGSGTLAAAEATPLGSTVTLLTVQGQALFRPIAEPAEGNAVTASASASPGSSAPAPEALPDSIPSLLAGLVASAGERLSDANEADGGTSRLLAAVGTGQLLQAESLAAAAGVAVPEGPARRPDPSLPTVSTSANSATRIAGAGLGTAVPPGEDCQVRASVELAAAVTAVLEAERQAGYAYQVALPRMIGDAAGQAAMFQEDHNNLAAGAEALMADYCIEPSTAAPGYALGAGFLANPAAGLGALETGALAAYGDLVAFTDGTGRGWAVQALLDTAQRAHRWGADPGPLPGLSVDPAALPPLPEEATTTEAASMGTPAR